MEKLVIAVLSILAVFAAYVMFVMVPVYMYAEAKCLRAGYPKAHVTVGLETYCSNLAGTVTVQVDKLK